MSLFNPFGGGGGGGGFSLPGMNGGFPGLPQIPGLSGFPGLGGQPQQPNYGGGGLSSPYQTMSDPNAGGPTDFHGLLEMLMRQNAQGGGGGQSYLGGQGLI